MKIITPIPLTDPQNRSIRAIAREECANFVDGNCLLLDNGDSFPCLQCLCRSLVCPYFVEAILPAHTDLNGELFHAGYRKDCVICGNIFYSHGKHGKYCDSCRKKVRRQKNKEYIIRHRLRCKDLKDEKPCNFKAFKAAK